MDFSYPNGDFSDFPDWIKSLCGVKKISTLIIPILGIKNVLTGTRFLRDKIKRN